MSQPADHPQLSAAEWKLIQDLRALPDPALQARLHASLEHLLFFFSNPRCQGMGVEGFPCGEPRSSCDECHQLWHLLDRIAARAKEA